MGKVETKDSKFRLISILLIISILMQILMPTLLPLQSIATEGDSGDGFVETSLGKLMLKSTATSLTAGAIVPVEIYIEGNNIFGITSFFKYNEDIFEPLKESDVQITPNAQVAEKWAIQGEDGIFPFYDDNNELIGYSIDLSETNHNSNNPGKTNFTVCIINLKVKNSVDPALLEEGTQVELLYTVITNMSNQQTSDDGVNCSLNLPVQAQAPTEYTVTYNANLPQTVTEDQVTIPSEQKIAIGTPCTIGNATITAVGYTFAGWNTKADGTGTPYTQGATYSDDTDLTLYAQWEEVKSTLIVNPNGGIWNGLSSETPVEQRTFEQRIGTTKEIPDPTTVPQGNTIQYNVNGGQIIYDDPTNIISQTVQTTRFTGWTGATLGGDNGKIYTYGDNSVTLIANYEGNSIKLPNATKEGHVCTEWTIEKDGETIKVGVPGGLYTPEYDPTGLGKIILTAKYEKQSYQLTVEAGDGTYNGATQVTGEYEEEKTLSSVEGPNGYTVILNWNDKATVDEATKISIVQKKSLDRWEKNGPGEVIENQVGDAKQYKFKFGAGDATITAVYKRDPINLEVPERTGYTFDGWYTLPSGGTKIENPSAYMPDRDNITLYAHWTPKSGVAYKVEHYKQDLNGTYPIIATEIEDKTGMTGETVNAEIKTTYEGYEHDITNTNNVLNGEVKADGTLVLKVYYKVKEYNVKFFEEQTQIGQDVIVKHKQTLNGRFPQLAEKLGYTFDGWYDENDNKVTESTQITEDMILKAKWTARSDIAYKVEHYKQNLDGTYPISATETENKTGTTATTVNAEVKTYEGYVEDTENTNKVLSGEVKADGSLILKVYYKVKEYNVKFFEEENQIGQDVIVKHKQTLDGKFPELAEKPGYTFDGWYDENDNKVTESTQITEDMILKAKWTLKADAVYKVEHYKQNLDGTYPTTATETEEIAGRTGTTVNAEVKTYEGYVEDTENTNKVLSGEVKADGSLILKVYYKVKEYNVKFFEEENQIGQDVIVKHKQTLDGKFPELAEKPGYTFDGWYDENDNKVTESTQITEDMILKAKWTARSDIAYKVEHYKQNLDGTYPISATEIENKTGTTATTVNAEVKTYEGYVEDTENTNKVLSGEVKADGSLILKVYYKVKEYNVKFFEEENQIGQDVIVKHKQTLDGKFPELAEKPGYTFDGWYDENDNKVTESTQITEDMILKAKWTARSDIAYKVEHYKQNLDGTYPISATETENKTGTTATTVNAEVKTYEGYEHDTENTNKVLSGEVKADGSLILKVYYKVKEYNVKFFEEENQIGQDVIVKHKQTLDGKFPELAEKPGYTFDGWYDENDNEVTEETEIIKDMTVKSKWTPNKYTITYENLQGSDNLENPTIYTVEDENIVLKDLPNKEDAIFEGWFDQEGNKVTSIDTSKMGNITISAKWKAIKKLYLKSQKYIVGENDIDVYEAGDIYMNKIEPNTTVAEFIENCDTNGKIEVIDQEGKVLSADDLIGTNMIIKDTGFGEEITMTAVVMGDLDGNGLVTVTDLSALQQVILKLVKVEGAVFMAADLDDNEEITVTDLSTVQKVILKVLELTYDKKKMEK